MGRLYATTKHDVTLHTRIENTTKREARFDEPPSIDGTRTCIMTLQGLWTLQRVKEVWQNQRHEVICIIILKTRMGNNRASRTTK